MIERNRAASSEHANSLLGTSAEAQKSAPTRLHLARWRGEIRILGFPPALLLTCVAISSIGFATPLRARNVNPDFISALLIATLEAFLPLAAGIVVTTIAARDDAIEVQLSLATPYYATVARRVALILAWSIATEFAATLAIGALFPSTLTKSGFDAVLLWLAPTLWLSAVGMTLALLLRSRATAAAILGVIWVVQLAFHGYFAGYDWTRPWFLFATLYTPSATYWRSNRLELIATAVAGLVVSWIYLHNSEWRFHGEDV
jgi:hypothetical protein